MTKKKMPFKRAFFWIFFSTLLISGSAATAIYYYRQYKNLQTTDPKNHIVTISQNGSLPTQYLAELMGLSVDQPVNLYQFDVETARQDLLASPLFKSAEVKKVKPGTLAISYAVRQPIALLADGTNTAIDKEGVLIPYDPFFELEKLPKVYLGGVEPVWGTKIVPTHLQRINLFHSSDVSWIDLSKADAPSYGQREIVVIVEDPQKKYLRLNPSILLEQLENYRLLESRISPVSTVIIDLRVPQLGFLSEE